MALCLHHVGGLTFNRRKEYGINKNGESMKQSVKSAVITVGVLLCLAACKNTSNKDPIANVQVAAADKDLQSKIFRGDCSTEVVNAMATLMATGGKVVVKSSREQYQFVGANVTRTTVMYESPNCEGQEILVFKETGSFKVDAKKRAEDQSKMIDIKYDKLTVAAGNAEGATAANELKLCGREDWAGGMPHDVTAQAGEGGTCYGKKLPTSEANIYRIDNNTLYFGDHEKSNEDRPTKANMSEKYVAQ